MIHAIRIKDGKLQYSNKYAMTDKLKEEIKHDKPVIIRTNELQSGMHGLIKMGIFELYKAIGYHPKLEQFKDGNANTAFVNHANKTYALSEQHFPFEIEIPKSD
jgi:carotenoid cleavage dioxygenase-like enzyme